MREESSDEILLACNESDSSDAAAQKRATSSENQWRQVPIKSQSSAGLSPTSSFSATLGRSLPGKKLKSRQLQQPKQESEPSQWLNSSRPSEQHQQQPQNLG